MNWIFFALLAPALYTTVTFVDKYLIEKHVKDYNAMPIYMGIVAAIAGSLFFIAAGYPFLPMKETLIVTSVGLMTAFALVFYFKALSFEDASNVNMLFLTFPVITLVLSMIFLNEHITIRQFIGFVMILAATMAASARKSKKKFGLSPAFWLIIIHNVLWASSGVLMKYAINVTSFSQVIAYESFGIAIGAIILFFIYPPVRKGFLTTNKNLPDKVRTTIMINEAIGVVAKGSTFYAFSLGPVALVSVLEGTQAFFAIVYGFVLTTIFPSIFAEDISEKTLLRKIFLAGVAIFGISLLS